MTVLVVVREHVVLAFSCSPNEVSYSHHHHHTEILISRCGGHGANMKCSVLQWTWKTLMNKLNEVYGSNHFFLKEFFTRTPVLGSSTFIRACMQVTLQCRPHHGVTHNTVVFCHWSFGRDATRCTFIPIRQWRQ